VERGLALHRQLQVLPDMEPAERTPAATRYIGRVGRSWPPHERERVLESVARVLDDPVFAPLFSAGSSAEVSVMGRVWVGGIERAVVGKIARLAASDEGVMIADYKTGRPPRAVFSAVPPAHVAQMALFRALMQPLYPGRPVRAALVYTERPALIEL